MSGPNSKRTDVTTDYAPPPGDYKPDLKARDADQKGAAGEDCARMCSALRG